MALKLKKSFPPWLFNTGQKEFGQVRGPARAVMRETRDLGIKRPYRPMLIFGNDIKIDMRFVSERCEKDVGIECLFGQSSMSMKS